MKFILKLGLGLFASFFLLIILNQCVMIKSNQNKQEANLEYARKHVDLKACTPVTSKEPGWEAFHNEYYDKHLHRKWSDIVKCGEVYLALWVTGYSGHRAKATIAYGGVPVENKDKKIEPYVFEAEGENCGIDDYVDNKCPAIFYVFKKKVKIPEWVILSPKK